MRPRGQTGRAVKTNPGTPMKHALRIAGLALVVSAWSPAARAGDPAVTAVAPAHAKVSFEGSAADVELGPDHRCQAPCQLDVAPGAYQLMIEGRPTHVIVVGNEPVKVVRL